MDFPKPLIIEPLQLPHQQTFILLHGRGSSGHKFGPILLETSIAPPEPLPPTNTRNHQVINRNTATLSLQTNSDSTSPSTGNLTLATAFPNARFVFPTAARRRATIYKRAYTHQWFDNWKLDPPATYREDLQIDGLRETVAYLHEVLREEINLVPGGARNIVFGGLSQGCAAALVSFLLWEGDKLGAAVGMCGWLPFADRMLEQVTGSMGNFAADAEDQIMRLKMISIRLIEMTTTAGLREELHWVQLLQLSAGWEMSYSLKGSLCQIRHPYSKDCLSF